MTNALAAAMHVAAALLCTTRSGVPSLVVAASGVLESVAAREEVGAIGAGPHSAINRVMFALALDPSVLVRRRAQLVP